MFSIQLGDCVIIGISKIWGKIQIAQLKDENEEENEAFLTIIDSKRRRMIDGPDTKLGRSQQNEQMMIDDVEQGSKNLFEAVPGSQARRVL